MSAWSALFSFVATSCQLVVVASWQLAVTGHGLGGGTPVKKSILMVLTAVLLASLLTGCGGEKEKGVNSNKDRPKAADRGE